MFTATLFVLFSQNYAKEHCREKLNIKSTGNSLFFKTVNFLFNFIYIYNFFILENLNMMFNSYVYFD